jgi:hypothetical protein
MLEPLSNPHKIFWKRNLVVKRLEEAASVLRRMPPVKVKGYFSTWPQIVPEFSDLVGQEPKLSRPYPPPKAISRMEETLWWTTGLAHIDAKILLDRAQRKSWKQICLCVGLSPKVAWGRREYALWIIVERLNGRAFKKLPSKNFVLTMIDFSKRKARQDVAGIIG